LIIILVFDSSDAGKAEHFSEVFAKTDEEAACPQESSPARKCH
jgi:hypothetical protein